ncbi:CRP-like cAMP-binding protein [Aequitasia blattaphilus]|uniref:Crp/Fnr family transcriptional regulator n=1 Tax=Aequitasia blattaphilus TaxID=2949332 RepID=A0ABT1E8J4_9FIRM|nr:Crp/Fnr family transcriptional regulator [Aequitasia blattaphilus]MCP1102148.1 Crp/Fnr family transcriptional regulator [Aequitasia blattaphilus]MCR8614788.1 Crp/Fnr family transcriptional regulator [Aequitasia blattaphilus]
MKDILTKNPLFVGIDEKELADELEKIGVKTKKYQKGEFILLEGDEALDIGIVTKGSAYVVHENYWGERNILTHLLPGDLFGEAFAVAGVESLPISVLATEEAEIVFIRYQNLIGSKILLNLLEIVAKKNIVLTKKMEHLSQRSIREKILSFLSEEARQKKSHQIEIPFNRQELADYLCVDRSALSRELGKMEEEGIVEFHKSNFTLQ